MRSPPAERAPAPEDAPEDPPVGALEHPGLASFQSGSGLLSGWVCEADVVEITGPDRTSRLDRLGRSMAHLVTLVEGHP